MMPMGIGSFLLDAHNFQELIELFSWAEPLFLTMPMGIGSFLLDAHDFRECPACTYSALLSISCSNVFSNQMFCLIKGSVVWYYSSHFGKNAVPYHFIYRCRINTVPFPIRGDEQVFPKHKSIYRIKIQFVREVHPVILIV